MSLLIFGFSTATVLTFFYKWIQETRFKKKALESLPKYGRAQAQSWPWAGQSNE